MSRLCDMNSDMKYSVICVGENNAKNVHSPQIEKTGDILGPFKTYSEAEESYRKKYQSMVWINFITVRSVNGRESRVLDGEANPDLKRQFKEWLDTGKEQW